jgi:transcriptional regulator with XRE-family HTH domain
VLWGSWLPCDVGDILLSLKMSDDISRKRKPKSNIPAVGKLLRDYRNYSGLTQEELAARSGVDSTRISRIESGDVKTPHPETLERLAQALASQQEGLAWQDLYAAFMRARAKKTKAALIVSPEMEQLAQRLAGHGPRARHVIWQMLFRTLDTAEELIKFLRKTKRQD